MKRIVLSTNRTTSEQDKAFIEIIGKRWPGLGWWHWLGETWLFADPHDVLTVQAVRDAALEAFPTIRIIVLEFNGGSFTWAGFGPNTPEKSMFAWFKTNWK